VIIIPDEWLAITRVDRVLLDLATVLTLVGIVLRLSKLLGIAKHVCTADWKKSTAQVAPPIPARIAKGRHAV
jgi:hypothetical protein